MANERLKERLGHVMFYSLAFVLALPTIYIFGASCAHGGLGRGQEVDEDLGPCSLNEYMGIGIVAIDETTGLAFEQMSDGRVVVCVNDECKTFGLKGVEL